VPAEFISICRRRIVHTFSYYETSKSPYEDHMTHDNNRKSPVENVDSCYHEQETLRSFHFFLCFHSMKCLL
jgi:hypothetical protein